MNFWDLCKIIASQILSASLACEVLSLLFGPQQAGDTPHHKRSFSSHGLEETSDPYFSDTHDHPGKSQMKSVCHVYEASVTFIVSVVKNVLRQLFPDLAPATLVFLSFPVHSRFSVVQIESNQFLDRKLFGNFLHKGNWSCSSQFCSVLREVSKHTAHAVCFHKRQNQICCYTNRYMCVLPTCTFMSVYCVNFPVYV